MIRTAHYTQSIFEARDASVVGGKAVSLGRLIRAGFPVPGGFVVNTQAYCEARMEGATAGKTHGAALELPAAVAEEIREAYRAMGEGSVAVRSSGTAEDMAHASMAGQYETLLDIQGEVDLLDAVRQCWESMDSPRIGAYFKEQGIDPAGVAMAVVIQRLIPAEVAGVLFTANPNGSVHEMLVEASWGLGESLVSGRVQPDVLRLDRETGRVISATIADKQVQLSAGSHAQTPVEDGRRHQACLHGRDVHGLWQLAKRAASFFGTPQDIEWAIREGEIYLLQSRPITTHAEAEAYEEALRTARRQLRQGAASGRGPWVLHNLAETLVHPTPLTWSVMGRFMSGAGGFGELYRQAGFMPSAAVMQTGFLECIGGRIYMDTARAPDMFFKDFPFAYDLDELLRSPDASQSPPTAPRGSFAARLRARKRLMAVSTKLRGLSADLDLELREVTFPAIVQYVAAAKQIDMEALSGEELVTLWQEREKRVMEVFGPRTLMPSLISGMVLGDLRAFIEVHFWQDDTDALAQFLSSGGLANRTLIGDAELYEVAKGTRELDEWLRDHGHRASGEFDLAAPRWREQRGAAREMAAILGAGDGPLERHRRHSQDVQKRLDGLRKRLGARAGVKFDRLVELVRRYVAFREDGKDFLMLGYDLLRDVALEAGRRLEIGSDVFYLTREELFDALRVGFATQHIIEQRKSAYRAEEQLVLPRVIDAAGIDLLGEKPSPAAVTGGRHAFGVSSGTATGPARIRKSPLDAGDLGHGYILVCPSTDPSWTPLFVNAAGLVLERGGALSHGAVVAREMGLPAVVLPDATRLMGEGEVLKVDGSQGWVGPVSELVDAQTPGKTDDSSQSTQIPRPWIPPPQGEVERRAAKIRNIAAGMWMVFLGAFFLCPRSWVYEPALSGLDALLWPAMRYLGRPGLVAVVAGAIALATLLIQKFFTDNARLLEARRRAAILRQQSNMLPPGSSRRPVLQRLAGGVQGRILMAALVPIGILLGPMVMPLVWFKTRVDPATWNAPAGSPVQVVALVDSEWKEPVAAIAGNSAVVDQTTPEVRTLPPLRKTLERLLTIYRQPYTDPASPWELQAAPDLGRQLTTDDLQAYLDAGIPPQGITWQIRPPENLDGKFPITVTTAGQIPITVNAVVGEKYPPAPSSVTGTGPIKELRIVYPRSNVAPHFWRPLAGLAAHPGVPLAGWLATVDVGWLWVYIIAYVPILMIMRAVLRIA